MDMTGCNCPHPRMAADDRLELVRIVQDVGRFGALSGRKASQRQQDQGKTDGLHATSSDFGDQCEVGRPTIGHA